MQRLGIIEPWIAPLAWQANIVGGLIFGVGMVIASRCITGLFYKLGHGMLGTLVALVTWAVGDILTYHGPLSPFREWLNQSQLAVNGQSATVLNIFGASGPLIVLALGFLMAVWLWRSPRESRPETLFPRKLWGWFPLGIAVGLFTSFAWVLADLGGSNYTYGTSGVPTSLYLLVIEGETLVALDYLLTRQPNP